MSVYKLLVLLTLAFVALACCLNCGDDDDDNDDAFSPYDDDDDVNDDSDDDDDADDDIDDDIDDDDVDDDVDDDDDDQDDPSLESFENSLCLNLKANEPQSIDFDYSDDVLTVIHRNGVFNCCLDYVDVEMVISEMTITLNENEYAPEPCNCVCPTDVTSRISGLAAGNYTIDIFANGNLAISGETVIP